jgi:hypothetical protein
LHDEGAARLDADLADRRGSANGSSRPTPSGFSWLRE